MFLINTYKTHITDSPRPCVAFSDIMKIPAKTERKVIGKIYLCQFLNNINAITTQAKHLKVITNLKVLLAILWDNFRYNLVLSTVLKRKTQMKCSYSMETLTGIMDLPYFYKNSQNTPTSRSSSKLNSASAVFMNILYVF